MESKRNGLLEIYRFLICFWPLYFHNFFYFLMDGKTFNYAVLSVDFFFILSGVFLMKLFRKEREAPVLKGFGRVMLGRVRPMAFTMCFITAFNLACLVIFIREDYYNTIHTLFMYWWFVLFLTVGVGVLYLIYRAFRKEKPFAVFLVLLVLSVAYIHYLVIVKRSLPIKLQFFTRTACFIPLGILISYIPPIKYKKFNPNIPFALVTGLTLLYLAYSQTSFASAVVMVVIFCALTYFSLGISVGGRFFDLVGKLSVRIYLYMSFVTMLYFLGLTNHRVLFVIDVSLSIMDLILSEYKRKYKKLKSKEKAYLKAKCQ